MLEQKKPHSSALRSVNAPELIFVRIDKAGDPAWVKLKIMQKVVGIRDRWRIDDEWWRPNAISRMYYSVVFENGRQAVVFKDLIGDKWYRQEY